MRAALWPERWPAIALQKCIDIVEAAPYDVRSKVRFDLPCRECPKSGACLNAKRKELGPLLYDREIMTQPRTSESSLFPREMLNPLLDRSMSLVPYWVKPFGDEERYGVCQAWDLAWSEKIGGDWLVCITAMIDRKNGLRHVLDIERWQRLTFDQQVKLIEAKWGQFQSDLVVIESDAAQKIWTQHMARNTQVPVLAHAASGKTDLASGVPALLILLEQQKWRFPYERGTYHWEEMNVFLAELEAFGWVDGKLMGVGEHDDTVMSWYHVNWGLDRLAVLDTPQRSRRGVQQGAYI